MERPLFWSDQLAFGVTKKFPERDVYVCSSGISPSGIVHVGNFREIITTDFVVKSLKFYGEDTRFIYYWDDYDRFRKVPDNVPDEWSEYIGLPLCEVPDPWECHESYADHFIHRLENELEDMKIEVEFIRQSRKYRNCEYAELMKKAMQDSDKIRTILNKYRQEPLEEDWLPLRIYCKECGRDFTEIKSYDDEYTVKYNCSRCGEKFELNFKENDTVKAPWRIQWPIWWKYSDIVFEPGGKDHSAAGSSRDTGSEIIEQVFDREPPIYQMYEFVTRDGGKISSSKGEEAFTISELKKVYSPELIRFLFSNTKPKKAFEIPFETEEIFQRYEKFDEIEHQYFNPEEVENERERKHKKRVYEMAMVEIPEEQPVRIPFKQASFVAQTVPQENWETEGFESLRRTGHLPEKISEKDKARVIDRMERAKNWAREYAPEKYVYQINQEIPGEFPENLSEKQREAAKLLGKMLEGETWEDQEDLDGKIFDVKEETELGTGEFFETMYRIILNRENGPRLSRLVNSVGAQKTAEILKKAS